MPWKEADSKVIREMIFKENEMMNFRITWLVTLQGLLFAALGFAWKDGKELIPTLALVGFLASIAALPTLYYAHHAIKTLTAIWDTNKPPDYSGLPVIGHYHGITKPSPLTKGGDRLLSIVSIW